MFNTTLVHLKCPRVRKKEGLCAGSLDLKTKTSENSRTEGGASSKGEPSGASDRVFEIRTGELECSRCREKFPILAGVAILVSDVRHYVLSHVKGIAKVVADSEIPREYRREYQLAKAEVRSEHIEEDMEAERVNALYFMTHFLRSDSDAFRSGCPWWKPILGPGSPLIDQLIREYWDQGPFSHIKAWLCEEGVTSQNLVELGCGLGGLYPVLRSHLQSYLGVDSSFASVAFGRHWVFGVPYRGSLQIPEDLLRGQVSRSIRITPAPSFDGHSDLIVGDLANLPLKQGQWDISVALNTLDMLEDPSSLPQIQRELLKKQGRAVQSCPYIWHPKAARKLRKILPPKISDSSRAVEWLYERIGFKIQKHVDHLPWLFFKNVRQLEIYSVHLFLSTLEN